MANLQCLPPTHEPRVSKHMDQIRNMIAQIIEKDLGYVVDGDVFFAVDKFPDYGKLSGQKQENNRAGERVAVDSRKRNPSDFALWKAAKAGEPSWESEWGRGRPGWHIECSAMSERYLSSRFDIHGGGLDLIFPHHENEIAQSCAASEDSDITERYHPLALRYFLINAHYRSPLNYSVLQLEAASEAVFYIYQTLKDCDDALSQLQEEYCIKDGEQPQTPSETPSDDKKCIDLQGEFKANMSDDLNTPLFLTGAFLDALKIKKQQKQQRLLSIQSLIEVEKEVKKVLDVLGMLPPYSYAEVLQQSKDKALKRAGLTEDDMLRIIDERVEARKNKDFLRSDQIRAELQQKGIALMDIGTETTWRPCVPVQPEPEIVAVGEPKAPAESAE
ncbi:Aminoacyl-tRNA synthetase, class 1a, anticodon-binding protein [Corchorus olitorius]|uniref:Aminoacyl-tRNA synthetase, class 1a, anticodon-binding protein n=1 Tax=Corchorus olitorius TaxID=93759 RepID=A0A1R3GDJ1_9ROSI|nr:Aminoacyl-tRNA synthetase, class 1a, anticodon-binding protein [Corchorus olitorius]